MDPLPAMYTKSSKSIYDLPVAIARVRCKTTLDTAWELQTQATPFTPAQQATFPASATKPASKGYGHLAVAAGDVVDGDLAFGVGVTAGSALVASVVSDLVVRGLQLLSGDGTSIPLEKDTAAVSEAVGAAGAGVALAVSDSE